MLKENINWENYSNASIDFILSQATKLFEESIKAYRETTNKCYAALTVYTGIIAYCLNKILSNNLDTFMIPYTFCLLGMSFCIYTLFETLQPARISLPGSQPVTLLIEYFESFELDEQDREYKEQVIIGYNNALISNEKIIKVRSIKFVKSIKILLFTIFFTIALYVFLNFTECHKL